MQWREVWRVAAPLMLGWGAVGATMYVAGFPVRNQAVSPALVIGPQVFVASIVLALAIASGLSASTIVSGILVVTSVVVLVSLPRGRVIVEAPDRESGKCYGHDVTICLASVHANNLARARTDLKPLRPLIVVRNPDRIVLRERSWHVGAADGEISVQGWSELESPGARIHRDSMVTHLAPIFLGYDEFRCSTWAELLDGRRGLTLAGEILQWYFWRYGIAQNFGPANLRPSPSAIATSGLAVKLRDTPDETMFVWLRSPAATAALTACGRPESVAAP